MHPSSLEQQIVEVLKVCLWRLSVATEDGRLWERVLDLCCDGAVCEQHELLDERVGLELLLLLDIDRVRGLGTLEVDCGGKGRASELMLEEREREQGGN